MNDTPEILGTIQFILTRGPNNNDELKARRFPTGTQTRGLQCARCGAGQISDEQEVKSLVAMLNYIAANQNSAALQVRPTAAALQIYAKSSAEFADAMEKLLRLFDMPS